MQFMVQVVVSNIIQVQVQGYHRIISVKAKEGMYMMTGVTRCYQLERAKVGLQ